MKIGIIGAGSFGTTLGHIFSKAGHSVVIWAREPEVVDGINTLKRNPIYHSEVTLHDELRAVGELPLCLEGKDALILAVPSKYLRDFMPSLIDAWSVARPERGIPLISIVKGMLYEPTELVSNFVNRRLGSAGEFNWLQFSGPNISAEMIRGLPTASVLACQDNVLAASLQSALSTQQLRIYTSKDVIGVEVCGAVKNVLAIACGIADGLCLGKNAMAVIITRGLLELKRILAVFGGNPETARGLSGLGDLIVTGFSEKSRNFQAGREFARGKKLAQLETEWREVAEGVRTVKAIIDFTEECQPEIEIPIIREVYEVIYHEKSPADALASLMQRPFKME